MRSVAARWQRADPHVFSRRGTLQTCRHYIPPKEVACVPSLVLLAVVVRRRSCPGIDFVPVGDNAPAQAKQKADQPEPPLEVMRMGSTRLRHTSWITSLAFAPGDKLLAAADVDGNVILWETATGIPLRQLPGKVGQKVAFSPNGKLLATAGLNAVIDLWDPATGKKLGSLGDKQNPQRIRALAFAPDGKTLVVGADNQVIVWDVATRKPVRQLQGHKQLVRAVAVSPDGKTIASGDSLGSGPAKIPVNSERLHLDPLGRPHWQRTAPLSPALGLPVFFERWQDTRRRQFHGRAALENRHGRTPRPVGRRHQRGVFAEGQPPGGRRPGGAVGCGHWAPGATL